MNRLLFVLLFSLASIALWAAVVKPSSVEGLEWDAVEKSYSATVDDTEAIFTFTVTNRTQQPVEIRSTATSCHCTVATAPRKPWILDPGASDTLSVRVDLLSRRGGLTKTIYVDTSIGEEVLVVHVKIPPSRTVIREMNAMAAMENRQAILKGDCASCHVTPAIGKMGAELFTTACQICHGSPVRASMVPDLAVATVKRDAAYWDKWIRLGGEGTMMPAFSKAHDGSLDDDQIKSLVEYLTKTLPSEPATN
jgi:cytochrome c553